MTIDEARECLFLHSGTHADFEHPKWITGFVGSLRPFIGLRQKNFDEVMECLRTLSDTLRSSTTIDRELANALWGISFLPRYWGCHKDGDLRRNGLISDEEIQTLSDWTTQIDWTVCMLLDGQDDECAFDQVASD